MWAGAEGAFDCVFERVAIAVGFAKEGRGAGRYSFAKAGRTVEGGAERVSSCGNKGGSV